MDEVEHFREHGWCVVRGAIAGERAEHLSRELTRAFPQSRWPSDRVHELPGISALNPELKAHDPRIAALVAKMLQCERVQLLQDTCLVKPPESAARVEWHQDHTYTGYFDRAAQVSVRLALNDCNEESGCLRVVDRSHLLGPLGEVRAFAAQQVSDDSQQLPPDFREREVLIELRPGDVSIHSSLTVHGSLENRSAGPRQTLISRLIDERSRLDFELLPPQLRQWFPSLASGQLDPARFPLL